MADAAPASNAPLPPDIALTVAAPRRSRWRIARTITICLLIGAIMNIAVAWGIVIQEHVSFRQRARAGEFRDYSSGTVMDFERKTWWRAVPPDWSRVAFGSASRSDRWGRQFLVQCAPPPNDRKSLWVKSYGFPMLSVETWLLYESMANSPLAEWSGAWTPRTILGAHFELPVAPRWIGVCVNTTCYALVTWSLWLIPLTLRRARRRRRNLCIRCGYPRAGIAANAACPECGASSAANPKHEPRASGTKRDA